MTEPYKTEALAAAHEAALGLAEAGLVSRKIMRVFDEICLTTVEAMSSEDNQRVRRTGVACGSRRTRSEDVQDEHHGKVCLPVSESTASGSH